MDDLSPFPLSQESSSILLTPNVPKVAVKEILLEFKDDINTCVNKIYRFNVAPTWKEIKKLQLDLKSLKGKDIPWDLFKGYVQLILNYIDIVMQFISGFYSDFQKQLHHTSALLGSVSVLFREETSCGIFLQRAATEVLDMVLVNEQPVIVKNQALRMLNDIIVIANIDIRKKMGKQKIEYLYKLFDWLSTLGEYVAQITVMKIIFNIFSENIKDLKYCPIPGRDELGAELININRSNVISEARKWLNKFNQNNNNICSFAYRTIHLGNINCECPNEGDFKYIDFNIKEKNASFYIKISEDNWSRVFILENHVDTVEIQSSISFIILTIVLTKGCVSESLFLQAQWNDSDRHIMKILLINDGIMNKLKLTLAKIFEDKFLYGSHEIMETLTSSFRAIEDSPRDSLLNPTSDEGDIDINMAPEHPMSAHSSFESIGPLERRSRAVEDYLSNLDVDQENNNIYKASASLSPQRSYEQIEAPERFSSAVLESLDGSIVAPGRVSRAVEDWLSNIIPDEADNHNNMASDPASAKLSTNETLDGVEPVILQRASRADGSGNGSWVSMSDLGSKLVTTATGSVRSSFKLSSDYSEGSSNELSLDENPTVLQQAQNKGPTKGPEKSMRASRVDMVPDVNQRRPPSPDISGNNPDLQSSKMPLCDDIYESNFVPPKSSTPIRKSWMALDSSIEDNFLVANGNQKSKKAKLVPTRKRARARHSLSSDRILDKPMLKKKPSRQKLSIGLQDKEGTCKLSIEEAEVQSNTENQSHQGATSSTDKNEILKDSEPCDDIDLGDTAHTVNMKKAFDQQNNKNLVEFDVAKFDPIRNSVGEIPSDESDLDNFMPPEKDPLSAPLSCIGSQDDKGAGKISVEPAEVHTDTADTNQNRKDSEPCDNIDLGETVPTVNMDKAFNKQSNRHLVKFDVAKFTPIRKRVRKLPSDEISNLDDFILPEKEIIANQSDHAAKKSIDKKQKPKDSEPCDHIIDLEEPALIVNMDKAQTNKYSANIDAKESQSAVAVPTLKKRKQKRKRSAFVLTRQRARAEQVGKDKVLHKPMLENVSLREEEGTCKISIEEPEVRNNSSIQSHQGATSSTNKNQELRNIEPRDHMDLEETAATPNMDKVFNQQNNEDLDKFDVAKYVPISKRVRKLPSDEIGNLDDFILPEKVITGNQSDQAAISSIDKEQEPKDSQPCDHIDLEETAPTVNMDKAQPEKYSANIDAKKSQSGVKVQTLKKRKQKRKRSAFALTRQRARAEQLLSKEEVLHKPMLEKVSLQEEEGTCKISIEEPELQSNTAIQSQQEATSSVDENQKPEPSNNIDLKETAPTPNMERAVAQQNNEDLAKFDVVAKLVPIRERVRPNDENSELNIILPEKEITANQNAQAAKGSIDEKQIAKDSEPCDLIDLEETAAAVNEYLANIDVEKNPSVLEVPILNKRKQKCKRGASVLTRKRARAEQLLSRERVLHKPMPEKVGLRDEEVNCKISIEEAELQSNTVIQSHQGSTSSTDKNKTLKYSEPTKHLEETAPTPNMDKAFDLRNNEQLDKINVAKFASIDKNQKPGDSEPHDPVNLEEIAPTLNMDKAFDQQKKKMAKFDVVAKFAPIRKRARQLPSDESDLDNSMPPEKDPLSLPLSCSGSQDVKGTDKISIEQADVHSSIDENKKDEDDFESCDLINKILSRTEFLEKSARIIDDAFDRLNETYLSEINAKKNQRALDEPSLEKTNRRKLYDPTDFSYLDEMMQAEEKQGIVSKQNTSRQSYKKGKGFDMNRTIIELGKTFFEELTPVSLVDDIEATKKQHRSVDISARSVAKKKTPTKRQHRRRGFDMDRTIIAEGITFFDGLGDSLRFGTKKTPTHNKRRQSKKKTNIDEADLFDLYHKRSDSKKIPTRAGQNEIKEIDNEPVPPTELCDQIIDPVDVAIESETNRIGTLPDAAEETRVKKNRIKIQQNVLLVPAKRPATDHVESQIVKKTKVTDSEKKSVTIPLQLDEFRELVDGLEVAQICIIKFQAFLKKIERHWNFPVSD